jgi:translation initiation factor 1
MATPNNEITLVPLAPPPAFPIDSEDQKTVKQPIHIRLQQRNGRKCLTLIEGMSQPKPELDNIVRVMRKTFHVSGAILKSPAGLDVVQLTGDQRKNVQEFLVKHNLWKEDDPPIKVHGV